MTAPTWTISLYNSQLTYKSFLELSQKSTFTHLTATFAQTGKMIEIYTINYSELKASGQFQKAWYATEQQKDILVNKISALIQAELGRKEPIYFEGTCTSWLESHFDLNDHDFTPATSKTQCVIL